MSASWWSSRPKRAPATTAPLRAPRLIAARCWWAGHGSRYVVRRSEEAVVALRGEEHEESDEVELVEVGRIDLPEGALLRVLGPDGSTSAVTQ